MTLGNMRELGVQRLIASSHQSSLGPGIVRRITRIRTTSELGHSRRFRHVWGMSAYPPIAIE